MVGNDVHRGIAYEQDKHDHLLIHHYIDSVSEILEEIIASNSNNIKLTSKYTNYLGILAQQKQANPLLNLKSHPKLSIRAYIERVFKLSGMQMASLICALILVDRFCLREKVYLTNFNVHKIMLASIVTSIKVNEDTVYSNEVYAHIGVISWNELNHLECEFLEKLNFDVLVSQSDFESNLNLNN